MLHTVWQQSPVTVLRFLSGSTVVIGCANHMQLYNWKGNAILASWKLRDYVTVHHVNFVEEPDTKRCVIVVGGNRFYAGAYLSQNTSSNMKFNVIFECYSSDNIVDCWVGSHNSNDWFCFVSAHGRTIVKRFTSADLDHACSPAPTTESPSLNGSVCYSGVIECQALSSELNTISFLGATFGQISVRTNQFRILPDGSVSCTNHTEVQMLHCQKGVIFSLSLGALVEPRRFHLVSAAEDRSVAVWSTRMGASSDVTSYREPWELLYRLDGGSMDGEVIFESRIRMVVASTCGVLAIGEDCRIVWYPWENMRSTKIIDNAHRGHGIWCADVWFPRNTKPEDALIISGGNDGAICLQSLELGGRPELEVLDSTSALNLTNSSPSDSNVGDQAYRLHPSRRVVFSCPDPGKDFPRSLFFGSDGRLFYVTELGRIYTVLITPDFTEPSQTLVEPYFKLPFSEAMDSRKSDFAKLSSSVKDPRLSGLFCGYTVCGSNQSRSFIVIGDRTGRVALLKFLTEFPYLMCTDVVFLNRKVMKLIWLNENLILAATQTGSGILLRLESSTVQPVLKADLATLHLPEKPTMRWISTACLCSSPSPETENSKVHALPLLVVGTRDGGLYTFRFDPQVVSNPTLDPVWSLEACHGRGGCTAVFCLPVPFANNSVHLVSCGRTHGELRGWQVDLVRGILVLCAHIPNSSHLTWVERFHAPGDGRVFALGFQSVNFKAYLLSADGTAFSMNRLNHSSSWFRAVCGGGNRPWDWWTSPYPGCKSSRSLSFSKEHRLTEHLLNDNLSSNHRSMAVLASLNKGEVLVQWSWSRLEVGPQLLVSKYIRPSLHGRDVNCCLMVPYSMSPCSNSTTNQSQALFCFAGGEDTTLSSWCLSTNGEKGDGWTFAWSPEHHRGHLSNIRCMAFPLELTADCATKTRTNYLLTGGGRGQICLWSLNLDDLDVTPLNNMAWRPGWLGFIRLRHAGSDNLTSRFGGMGRQAISRCSDPGSTDLRVMALTCLTRSINSAAEWLVGLAACSDGSIRLIGIHPPSLECPRNPRIHEVGSLEALSGQHDLSPACYLDLHLSDFDQQAFLVIASTTRGELRGWSIRWPCSDDLEMWFVTLNWILLAQPIVPYKMATNPAFNCLGLLDTLGTTTTASVRIAVGADDGSVRVASVPSLRCKSYSSVVHDPVWITSSLHHFATVIRLCVVPTQLKPSEPSFITLSADQRVICWRFNSSESVLVPLQRALLAGLGDPHGMDIVVVRRSVITNKDTDAAYRTYVLATGTGSILLELCTM